ncbi:MULTISPECIES: glycerophosphodiester phosphodiesterase [unclassified Streptomyces]|uniref:glycerophosphodiester phosphodiesterase n=1 Tax=unclassified Streptomyces TaxID=2593676 RepID=UPI0022AE9364|nr:MULTISPECIES: glycerophosphodiester phosphodiesterase [unclassified Streptomyces]MCZ4097306.1 glycerophosphodiester phosphodiesterase [Streptomyces sp. H39-C1]MCZ4120610.1 glycerophosphodiester phosphodiesterase [Streptomyces sp. H39-S7]
MTRYLFGGTTDTAAETSTGARLPFVTGTAWESGTDNALQLTDLLDINGNPLSILTADASGMIPAFYGPDGTEYVWIDFGAGRYKVLPTDTNSRLKEHLSATDPHGSREWATTRFLPQTSITVDDLISEMPFYIAHRGSGMEYPEHTLMAYESAIAHGAKAIEVSANVTSDGVLVCLHDALLDRTTNSTGSIESWTYAAVHNKVRTNAGPLLGSGWVEQPLTPLRDVLDRFMGRCIIFLEPKSNAAVPVLKKLLSDFYPYANQSVVWKSHISSNTWPWAKAQGFQTWAYLDVATTNAQMDAIAENIDMWGTPYGMTDARIAEITARRQLAIGWEVHRRSERDRLVGLGVRGMMCPQIQYVRNSKQLGPADDWATGIKAPGDMGYVTYDPARALKYDGTGGVYFGVVSGSGLIGSRSLPTPPSSGYRVQFDMRFDTPPPAIEHAGIAFGRLKDDTYRFGAANASGGYHLALRGSGDLQLYTHAPGSTTGTQLAAASSAAPAAGQWVTFQIDVTPTQVIVKRIDVTPNITLTVNNTAYRGGYVHLSNGTVTTLTARPIWRRMTITPL